MILSCFTSFAINPLFFGLQVLVSDTRSMDDGWLFSIFGIYAAFGHMVYAVGT
jgi:hypothetical protein